MLWLLNNFYDTPGMSHPPGTLYIWKAATGCCANPGFCVIEPGTENKNSKQKTKSGV